MGVKMPEVRPRRAVLFEEIAADALLYSKEHKNVSVNSNFFDSGGISLFVLRVDRAKIPFRMKQIKSWTVSDELWNKVEPLVPARQRAQDHDYKRKPGGGRKPMAARNVFAAIIYVLRTGCQWKALPRPSDGDDSGLKIAVACFVQLT